MVVLFSLAVTAGLRVMDTGVPGTLLQVEAGVKRIVLMHVPGRLKVGVTVPQLL